jgi:RNA polymerase sigma-70 factor (ECF subfamily)
MKRSEKENYFRTIFMENKDKIYRLCYGYLDNKSEMDDLFQEVMFNIWKGLDSFKEKAKVSTWIYRVTVNTALMYNKKLKKQKMFGSLKTDSSIISQSEQSNHDEKLTALYKSISSLKKQDRLIISLLLEGLSYAEISDIVGITINHVGVKINRIKQSLEKMLKNDKFI